MCSIWNGLGKMIVPLQDYAKRTVIDSLNTPPSKTGMARKLGNFIHYYAYRRDFNIYIYLINFNIIYLLFQ